MIQAFYASALASRSKRALVALVGGLGAVSGFSPSGLPWLTLACLALLFLVWLRTPTPREAALNGFLFGLGLFGAGASWVYISLHDFGMMPAPLAAAATAFFCVYLALFPALAGSLQARLDAPSWMQAIFVIPGCWVITEWMRSWLLTGFPWLAMGYSQVDGGFSGYAPLMGMYGVSLLMAMAAGSIAAALLPAPNAVRARLVLVAIGIFAVGVMLRLVDWVTPHGAPVPVALIQGNIAQEQKFEPQQYLATLATYQRLIESTKAQLVVLPETAVPRFLDLVDPDYLDGLAAIMRRRGGDLLLGAPFRTSNGNYYNGVVNLGHSDLQFYAKSHLVPLGEFVPAEFKWIVSTLRIPLSDFSAGKRSKPLLSAGERIGITVCYEDAFGEELISQLPEATLLANLSNVAWFGDSLAPGQHLQISRMRSIEAGRYMLRATNTGVTAIIDQRGNVEAQLPLFSEGVLHGNAQAFSGATPYVRVGNYLSLVLCWLFLLGGIALSLRSRHSQATAPH